MLHKRIQHISSEFSEMPSDMLRYSFLVELSAYVPSRVPGIMSDEHLVSGCHSLVWIKLWLEENAAFQMKATSDTLIIRGILHVVMQLLNGCPAADIAQTPLDILGICRLGRHVSSSRGDGIMAITAKIQDFCRTSCPC